MAKNGIRHPSIKVRLTGQNGNAFMIIGLVMAALRKAGVSQQERDEFKNEAMSGDYDNLLQTAMRWVCVS